MASLPEILKQARGIGGRALVISGEELPLELYRIAGAVSEAVERSPGGDWRIGRDARSVVRLFGSGAVAAWYRLEIEDI